MYSNAPRETHLQGWRLGVAKQQVPVRGDDGALIHERRGDPKFEEQTALLMIHPAGMEVLVLPLSPEAKQELVSMLTGVIVPTPTLVGVPA